MNKEYINKMKIISNANFENSCDDFFNNHYDSLLKNKINSERKQYIKHLIYKVIRPFNELNDYRKFLSYFPYRYKNSRVCKLKKLLILREEIIKNKVEEKIEPHWDDSQCMWCGKMSDDVHHFAGAFLSHEEANVCLFKDEIFCGNCLNKVREIQNERSPLKDLLTY